MHCSFYIRNTVEADPAWLKGKQNKREIISLEEENAIRYVAGFVVTKMKKKYKKRESVAIYQCLLSMEQGASKDDEESGD